FEINRNFRNEGVSPRHNPEFTMLEAYEAYGNWETMAELVEDMTCTVAEQVCGGLVINHAGTEGIEGRTIDLSRPWRRVSMADLVEERTGWRFAKRKATPAETRSIIEHVELRTCRELGRQATSQFPQMSELFSDFESLEAFQAVKQSILELLAALQQVMKKKFTELRENYPDDEAAQDSVEFKNICENMAIVKRLMGAFQRLNDQERLERDIDQFTFRFREKTPAEQLTEVYEKLIEPTLINPTFVTRVPGTIIPLAKRCQDDDYFADVYELAINGVEISPGYSELNDPDVQEAQFRQQVGDEAEKQQIDEDFLEALRVGMPPAGGMGLGIDRLIMMLTGAQSIRDVILFPLMRPRD
ncbi:MAG: amino acid--tRNA ligase-related protein, partial [Planctomycetota bacterium]